MMASTELADAKVEARVLSDMLGKANEETRTAQEALDSLKQKLSRAETLRAEAERQLTAEEDRVKELESRLDHDRQIVADTRKTKESDKEVLRAEMQGLTDEHEVEVERLNAQIKKLRDDARSARESTGSEEKMVAAVREECDAEAAVKLKRALASEQKKTDRAYSMLKEDYEELQGQYAELQKKMRARIRDVEQTHANEDRMSPEARCRLDLDVAPYPEQPACGLPRRMRWLELPGSGGVRVAVLYVNMDKSAMRRTAIEASLRAADAPFRRIPGVALVNDSGSNISVSDIWTPHEITRGWCGGGGRSVKGWARVHRNELGAVSIAVTFARVVDRVFHAQIPGLNQVETSCCCSRTMHLCLPILPDGSRWRTAPSHRIGALLDSRCGGTSTKTTA